jgi:hypothetical protein
MNMDVLESTAVDNSRTCPDTGRFQAGEGEEEQFVYDKNKTQEQIDIDNYDVGQVEKCPQEWVDDRQHEGWCWYTGDERIVSLWNYNTDAKTSIDAMHLWARADGFDKGTITIPLERRLPRIIGVRFEPKEDEVFTANGCTYRNKFKSQREFAGQCLETVSVSEMEDRIADPLEHLSEFKDFIQRITGCQEDEDWITGWLAHMIQKPWERPSVHPLFRTQHGIGKNVLVEQVMGKLLADQTVTTSLKEIRNTHSESAANNLLVLVDESKAKGMNVYLEMKSLLTATEMPLNPKYVRPYKQKLYSRFMFADNTEGRAFSIEQEDRRIYVCRYVVHECDKEETQEFIESFLAWFECSWYEVYEYLDNYDISDWNPYVCPMTEAKRDYLDMCEDPTKRLVKEYRQQGWETITAISWNSYMAKESMAENFLWQALHIGANFKFLLEEEGYRAVRATKVVNGRQQKINAWVLDGVTGTAGYNLVLKENAERAGEPGSAVCASAEAYSV